MLFCVHCCNYCQCEDGDLSTQTNEYSNEFIISILIITAQTRAMETRREGGCPGSDGRAHLQCPQRAGPYGSGWL